MKIVKETESLSPYDGETAEDLIEKLENIESQTLVNIEEWTRQNKRFRLFLLSKEHPGFGYGIISGNTEKSIEYVMQNCKILLPEEDFRIVKGEA